MCTFSRQYSPLLGHVGYTHNAIFTRTQSFQTMSAISLVSIYRDNPKMHYLCMCWREHSGLHKLILVVFSPLYYLPAFKRKQRKFSFEMQGAALQLCFSWHIFCRQQQQTASRQGLTYMHRRMKCRCRLQKV